MVIGVRLLMAAVLVFMHSSSSSSASIPVRPVGLGAQKGVNTISRNATASPGSAACSIYNSSSSSQRQRQCLASHYKWEAMCRV